MNKHLMSANEIIRLFIENDQKTALTYVDTDENIEININYAELAKHIATGSSFFHNANFKTGDSISYYLDNSPEMLILDFICILNSYRGCPLDIKCDTEEMVFKKLQQTKSKAFFYRRKMISPKFISKLENELNIKTFPVNNISSLNNIFNNDEDFIFRETSDDDTVLILYTSGTTGFPKGVMLSKKNICYGIDQVSSWLNIKKEDVFYIVLPLYHINSIMYSLATLLAGGTVIIPSRYSSSKFFPQISRYQATMTSIVPTINYDLLSQKEIFTKLKRNIKLKLVQIGSAPVSPTQAFDFFKHFGIRLIQGYGLTETTHRTTGIPIDLDVNIYKRLLKENSIGKTQKHSNVKIVDNNNMEIVKSDIPGEIIVSGNNITSGYLGLEETTKKVIENNFFHTGDIGYFKIINNEKYYYILGRNKEIIIKGGINISPVYVEEQLRKIITWAKEIVVVGFPHYRYGEEVGVIIVPKNKKYQVELKILKNQLKKFKISTLSKYETPQSLVISSDKNVDKTQIGKIQHVKVRERFKEKLISCYHNNFHDCPKNAKIKT